MKLLLELFLLPFRIIFFPFKIIFSIFGNSNKSVFEQESELWGLSKEDIKRAKEERVSPADYVEAEEYDDDNLDLDEWER